MKRSFLTTCIILLFFVISGQDSLQSQKRLALVIGNSAYEHGGVLKNPASDAKLMASTLVELGFDVIKRVDATKKEMDLAILNFWRNLVNYDITLFYYAGHGIQVEGVNYLLPVDAKIDDKYALQIEAVDVNKVVHQFEQYPDNINIVILDACRDNPYRSWMRSGSGGFTPMAAPSGTIIAFATSAGATASDGDGSNGLYTEKLAKQMLVNQRIEDVFINTRNAVRTSSNGRQNPQEWSQLTGKFYFKSDGTDSILGSEISTPISINNNDNPDDNSTNVIRDNKINTYSNRVNANALRFAAKKLKPHINDEPVSMKKALSFLSVNDIESYIKINKYYKKKLTARIIMIGGYAIGAGSLYLSSQDMASEGILIAGIVGAVAGICTIPFSTKADNNLKREKMEYNSRIQGSINFGPTENGMGLVYKF